MSYQNIFYHSIKNVNLHFLKYYLDLKGHWFIWQWKVRLNQIKTWGKIASFTSWLCFHSQLDKQRKPEFIFVAKYVAPKALKMCVPFCLVRAKL